MFAKRIIPCLDVRAGRTVKGVNFENLRDAGDAVELAALYAQQGADELVFLDISATIEQRKTLVELVERVAATIFIPFTVGGGIRSVEDCASLLKAGADKVSINSAAVRDPDLITRMAQRYGSQCVVVAIDIKLVENTWYVFVDSGKTQTTWRAIDWAQEVERRGAGEILLTSMGHDGTKAGFALEITKEISQAASIPVVASGGAGSMQDFVDVFTLGAADAALAASVFHFAEIRIPDLKKILKKNGIPVRLLES
jgi:imidazole glycerol-phosphate synthase subunit HisF